jgi:hypothetical protein
MAIYNIAFPILINGHLIVWKTQLSLNLKRNFQLKWLQISELIKVHFIMQLNIIQIMTQALEQLGNIFKEWDLFQERRTYDLKYRHVYINGVFQDGAEEWGINEWVNNLKALLWWNNVWIEMRFNNKKNYNVFYINYPCVGIWTKLTYIIFNIYCKDHIFFIFIYKMKSIHLINLWFLDLLRNNFYSFW